MLTHHSLEMLKRRTGLTEVQWVKLIEPRYYSFFQARV